ncbi:MAG: SDR family oxidoreductase [Haliea sp.]|uniref:SDR family NAD(P)-dependent oxidoreductase n=1 Tax=Haliea sp. TaxID=1932666 RepID=UPI0032ED68A9
MERHPKLALITGSARGLGFDMARHLGQVGHRVIVSDLNDAAVADAVAALRELGIDVIGKTLDVTDAASVTDVFADVRKEVGVVDILINNAGICKDTPALEVEMSLWQANLDIMLTGALSCVRAAAPGMIEKGWGRVINMASQMSFTAFGRDVAYCTAKAGILGLTRSLAMDLGPYGITVNAICPGVIESAMLEEVAKKVEKRDGLEDGDFLRSRAAAIPRRRIGQCADVSKLATFLCSDDSDYIHGQSLHVNGGLLLT